MTQKGSSKKFWIISVLVIGAIGLNIFGYFHLRRKICKLPEVVTSPPPEVVTSPPPEGMFRITPKPLFPGDAAYSANQLFDMTWASLLEHPSQINGLEIWAELWIDGKWARPLGRDGRFSYMWPAGVEFVSLTMRQERVCPEREGDYVFRFAHCYFMDTFVLSSSYLQEISDEVWERRYPAPEIEVPLSLDSGSETKKRRSGRSFGFIGHGETVLRPDSEDVILVAYVEMEGIYWS